ncbi:hypothetical protein FKM82_029216 [Ascaphus truei]
MINRSYKEPDCPAARKARDTGPVSQRGPASHRREAPPVCIPQTRGTPSLRPTGDRHPQSASHRREAPPVCIPQTRGTPSLHPTDEWHPQPAPHR